MNCILLFSIFTSIRWNLLPKSNRLLSNEAISLLIGFEGRISNKVHEKNIHFACNFLAIDQFKQSYNILMVGNRKKLKFEGSINMFY